MRKWFEIILGSLCIAGGLFLSAAPVLADGDGCDPMVPAASGEFEHRRNALLVKTGAARHSAQDAIVLEGNGVILEGKFAYGDLAKDLEDEPVRVFMGRCGEALSALGVHMTDDDGRARVMVREPPKPGVYQVRFQVQGDGSMARATLRVYPKGTRLTVFDIDGTLTTGDEEVIKDIATELFKPLREGTLMPEAYAGGAALTQAHAARGEALVYLTGRPYWLTRPTEQWLQEGGFAAGTLHTTQSSREAWPDASGVGQYKEAYLQGLLQAGFEIEAVYGNAETDLDAYFGAGISPTRIWIIGPHAGKRGSHAAGSDWRERAASVVR